MHSALRSLRLIITLVFALNTVVHATDFGLAAPYNAFVFASFSAPSSDVEGRLAAGGDISLNHYSVGDKLAPDNAGDVLVSGGDINFADGRVYYGNIVAAGSTSGISSSVANGMASGATIQGLATLPVDFNQAYDELSALSSQLAQLNDNTTYESLWGGLYLHGDCQSEQQVFHLEGSEVLNAHTFAVDCIPDNAEVIFNISGAHPGLSNMSLSSLSSHSQYVIFNFYEAQELTLSGIAVEGSILAPDAIINNPQGVIKGQLIANAWDGMMQINHVPFIASAGNASNHAPLAQSEELTTAYQTSLDIHLSGSDADSDPLSFTVLNPPEHGSLSGNAPILSYTPDSTFSGTDSLSFYVNDGTTDSEPARIIIHVEPDSHSNQFPTVNAGADQIILLHTPVTLNARASDPDGHISHYQWQHNGQISQSTQGMVLTDLPLGEHQFSITVTDNEGASASDNVTITVQTNIVPPGRIAGQVLDQRGVPVANARVHLSMGQSTVSDREGNYLIDNLIPVERATATASHNGFLSNSEIIQIISGKESLQNIIISRAQNNQSFDSTTPITINAPSGLSISLPANAYIDNQGNDYQGNLNLSSAYFPITTEAGINEFPGDTLAINNNNEIGDLVSLGFVKLQLTDDLGNELQLAPGQSIELNIPADNTLDKPATIPLWYFDEDKGLWVEDGIATYDPVSNSYRTATDRIATFNLDHYRDVIASVAVCIEDEQGNKVPGYIAIEPEDHKWRKLSKTSVDGLLRLNNIIGESKFNLYAASLDGYLGSYIHNPVYLNAGENSTDGCIIIESNRRSQDLQIDAKLVNGQDVGQADVFLNIYGIAAGQTASTPGLIEMMSEKSNAEGQVTFNINALDPLALELAMLSQKPLSFKALQGTAKGEAERTLIYGQTYVDLGHIVLIPNQLPIADAGIDQVVYAGAQFLLDARQSYDINGSITQYEWHEGDTHLGSGRSLYFSMLALGKHRVVVTVTDDLGDKSSDDVIIDVVDNSFMVADAGRDQSLYLGESVQLNTDKSRSTGRIVNYQWTDNGQLIKEGNDWSIRHLDYQAQAVGEHHIKLTITNEYGVQASDDVTVTVLDNHYIHADAGRDQSLYLGESIQLSTDNSRSTGRIVNYQWTDNGQLIKEGNDWSVRHLDYQAQAVGEHHLRLTITDEYGIQASDDVSIQVTEQPTITGDLYIRINKDSSLYSGGSIELSIKGFYSAIGGSKSYKWTEGSTLLSNSSSWFSYTPDTLGDHIVRVTVTDANGLSAFDEVTIHVLNGEIHADAGLDQTQYLGNSSTLRTTLSYSLASNLTYQWSENGVVLNNNSSVIAYTADTLGEHTITLTVTDKNGLVATDDVLVTAISSDIHADAGLDQTQSLGSSSTLSAALSYSLASNLTYQWLENGVVLSRLHNFAYTSESLGQHTLTLIVTDAEGLTDSDNVTITVISNDAIDSTPPVITLNGNNPIIITQGDSYIEPGATAIDDKDGVITQSILINNPILTTAKTGLYQITYTVSDRMGNSSRKTRAVEIISGGPDTTPPVITLLGDTPANVIQDSDYNDAGVTVMDNRDGVLGYTFDTDINTAVPGTYQYHYSATDSAGNRSEAIRNIIVTGSNSDPDTTPPVITLIGANPINSLIDTDFIDPGASVIDERDGNLPYTTQDNINTHSLGAYQITYSAIDNAGNTAQVTRNVYIKSPSGNQVPIARAGDDITTLLGDNLVLDGSNSVDIDGTIVSYQWQEGSDILGNSASININSLSEGTHNITLSVTDNDGASASDGLIVQVLLTLDTTAPTVNLSTPSLIGTANIITAPTDITGQVYDEHLDTWQLLLQAHHGDNIVLLAQGDNNTPVNTDTLLGQLDPSLRLNGLYNLILRASDTSGNQSNDSRTILIDGQMKLGHFSITFEDHQLPISKLPIRITRTYDTRRSQEILDFGYGWSLGYQDIRLEESRPAGYQWELYTQSAGPLGILDDYCVRPLGDNLVILTLPNGDVERFKAKAVPECQLSQPTRQVHIEFEAQGQSQSHLEGIDYTGTWQVIDGHLVDLGDPTTPAEFDRYRLTTEDGMQYIIDQYGSTRGGYSQVAIEHITEPEGETLVLNDDGITHSLGQHIDFIRDELGRITRITLPDGSASTYSYDAQGNLASTTDANGHTTTFSYLDGSDSEHYLDAITDPLGHQAIKNEYNSQGRLVAQIDAQGKRTEYQHDIEGRLETITDPRGNTSTYSYDERGHILSETNALGDTTLHTYDSYGNELSRTNALNQTQLWSYDARGRQISETDALGHTTETSYDRYNAILTITEPDGTISVTNEYKRENKYGKPINGPLTKMTDALGNITSLIYVEGQLNHITDALGNTHVFRYNGLGQKTEQIDPNGLRTTYTYDANGRTLSETQHISDANGDPQSLTTSYVYDNKGNLTQTTNPLGHISQTQYNANDQIMAEVDPLGQRIEYEYDAKGQKTLTRYSDGTTQSNQYDANGNRIQSTNRAGQSTTYTYDAANRLVSTTYSDGSSTYNSYNGAGQLITSTDALGHASHYQYDAAGHRILIRDPLGHTSVSEYDANGQRIASIDAKGQRTDYSYDANGQLIGTDDPQGNSTQSQYDALGRRISQSDQNEHITQYEYDASGNLSAVIDAIGQRTEYRYDERNNKISQRDAKGHTTTWTYDALNRNISRTLPLGQSEYFSYDVLGNIRTKIDFNGDTTQYQYDDNNHRLIQVDYADGQSDYISYDVQGNRTQVRQTPADHQASQSDAVSQWQYDSQSRVIKASLANGETIQYQYDAQGNRTQVSLKDSNDNLLLSTLYTFDALNRLESVTDTSSNAGSTEYNYDEIGNRQSITYPNGTWQTYRYNKNNQLIQLSHYNASDQLVQRYDYTLDATGRRTQISEFTGRTSNYSYDTLYRLSEENITDPSDSSSHYQASYGYDAVGNRSHSIINGVNTEYTYDANDRLLQQGSTLYTYDANGNTLIQTLGADETSYQYDSKNQMVQSRSTHPGTDAQTRDYHYNSDGIRDQKTEDGTTTHYSIDANRDYAQVIARRIDNNLSHTYTYGDDLVSQTHIKLLPDITRQTHYYHYDGLGSTRILSDDSGSPSDYYDYSAFGEILSQGGLTDNEYLFTGEQFDEGLGFYALRARYYDPKRPGFTQMDTFEGWDEDTITLHKYLYANTDPVNGTDPSGHMAMTDLMAGINGFGNLLKISLPRYKAVERVLGGLIGAGLGYGLSDELKEFIARNAPSISQVLEEKRIRTKAKVQSKSRARKVLYNYGSRGRVIYISTFQVGPSSAGYGRGRPSGFYATDIPPWNIQYTQEELSALFYGGDRSRNVSWFVAFDGESFRRYGGNNWEYYRPSYTGETNLDIITIGPNLMLPK